MVSVIPVLDILNGNIVRAVGGRRGAYAPLESPLVSSPDPLPFVEKVRSLFGMELFYIADLDAIMGKGSNAILIERLVERTTCSFLLDGGYRGIGDIAELPRVTPVLGSETFEEWRDLGDLSRITVSVDTYRGNLVTTKYDLTVDTLLELARAAGAKSFIHLRMEAVGEGLFDTAALIPPRLGEKWIAGGGIRSRADLKALADAGYSAALVSSALHEGALP